jgi:hypothetical protein
MFKYRVDCQKTLQTTPVRAMNDTDIKNANNNTVSKRLTTYLPDGIYDQLETWATKERRSISNLAAFLLEESVREKFGYPKLEDQQDKPSQKEPES